MKYLKNNLQPGETVQYKAKLHLFLFLQPVVLALLGYSCYIEQGITHYLGVTLLFLGVVSLIQRILVKIGSVYAVTNKRVILKTGVLSRKVVDLVLVKCEGIHVSQSVFGRIFNYGTITVTTGGAISSYPFICKPLAFKKEINTQIG